MNETDFRKTASKILKKYRKDHELTQKKLGDKVGRSQSYISSIENKYHDISVVSICETLKQLNVNVRINTLFVIY